MIVVQYSFWGEKERKRGGVDNRKGEVGGGGEKDKGRVVKYT